jgi:hypothetical protein
MEVLVSPRQTSTSLDAILTTTYADDYTTRGNSFLFEKNISILNGGTANVLLDYKTYQPTPSQSGMIFVFPPNFATTSGPVAITVYRETDYTGGSQIVAYNPNTLAPKKTSGTTITTGASGSNKGTATMEYLAGGGSGGVGHSMPGATVGLSFFVRKNTNRTLVEIVNNSGSNITFHYSQILYEI